MPLNHAALNQPGDPVEFSWTEDGVMLYALAVGAGQNPLQDLNLTTENSTGVSLTALPTYANIITRAARVSFGDINMAQLVHASQGMTLHHPIPTSGRAIVTPVITEILDKGSGALLSTEQDAVDAESGEPLATTRQTVFIRNEGGFGGQRGSSATPVIPDRSADQTIEFRTRPEQALIYRLTGDRNPLHADPTFAAQGGWERPILHGMCTYGFTGRALIMGACDGEPHRLVGMDARFTSPVMPGDALSVDLWHDGDTTFFRTRRGDTVVIDQGRADIAPGN